MRVLRSLFSNRKAAIGAVTVMCFAVIAIVGPFLVADPVDFVATPLQPPSLQHWFGTTGQGQDVLAQTVVGARLTLAVALASGLLTVLIGAIAGGVAGYFGGWVDDAVSLGLNVFLVMPGLPLMVVIAAWLPPGPVTMLVVLVVTGWAWHARVLRAQTLTLRRRDFVAAARIAGDGALRVIVIEILPNMASLLASSFIGATIYAIGAQVGLEFLGLGDLGSVTWGTNLYWASNDSALLTGSWWTFVPTGASVALIGFGLAMLNFGIDELTNPRLSAQRGLPSGSGPVSTPIYQGGDDV